MSQLRELSPLAIILHAVSLRPHSVAQDDMPGRKRSQMDSAAASMSDRWRCMRSGRHAISPRRPSDRASCAWSAGTRGACTSSRTEAIAPRPPLARERRW